MKYILLIIAIVAVTAMFLQNNNTALVLGGMGSPDYFDQAGMTAGENCIDSLGNYTGDFYKMPIKLRATVQDCVDFQCEANCKGALANKCEARCDYIARQYLRRLLENY